MAFRERKRTPWVTALIEIPLFYNPDEAGQRRLIEEEKFKAISLEISQKFGGCFRHPVGEGFWWDRGVYWRDDMILVEVDVPDEEESRSWLLEYSRKTLLPRFQQKAIYIKWIRMIDVTLVRISEENGDNQ